MISVRKRESDFICREDVQVKPWKQTCAAGNRGERIPDPIRVSCASSEPRKRQDSSVERRGMVAQAIQCTRTQVLKHSFRAE